MYHNVNSFIESNRFDSNQAMQNHLQKNSNFAPFPLGPSHPMPKCAFLLNTVMYGTVHFRETRRRRNMSRWLDNVDNDTDTVPMPIFHCTCLYSLANHITVLNDR